MPTTVSIEYTLYKLEELSEDAKAKAFDRFCGDDAYPWHDENIASLKAFCDRFNVTVKDYVIGDICYGSRNYVKTNVDNSSFRGLKFKQFDFGQMPTSYYMDGVLFSSFRKHWEKTGSAYKAFQEAIDDFLIAVNKDVEHYFSMESFAEMSEANEWTYLESGKLFLG
jgi:hypothetical protein